jgi:hypothetical protein
MRKKLTVFDDTWFAQTQMKIPIDSWVSGAITSPDGSTYLDVLRLWFDRFPLSSTKDRRALKARLESLNTSDHLGGENELSWWEFMRCINLHAEPIRTTNKPRPDFKMLTPLEFFVEVSTLNVSETEKKTMEEEGAIPLDHAETLRRLLLKATNDKKDQIFFATSELRPCLLVLFDYTTWSGFGTQFFRFLANALFGATFEFALLPVELSALVYVEKKVIDGRVGISRDRSAIYYNPNAKYPLPFGTFSALRQFRCHMTETEPTWPDYWIWL